MSDTRHVVLTKPGDTLLISNLGPLPVEQLQRMRDAFRTLKIEVLCFAADIDIARADIGPDDCGCGGCDSCAQHALLRDLAQQ